MRRLFTYTLAATFVLGAAPSALAQVYPERVIVKVHKAVATAAAYQRRGDDREEQTERSTRTVHPGSSGVLDLGNIAGDITVVRGGGGDATIEIVKTARARTAADAKDQLQLVQVEVTERNGRAEIRARYPNGGNRRSINVSVAYAVTAPAGVRISIESISGSIKVTDIKGDLNAATTSGDIRISGAGRVGTLKSISGSVEVDDAQVDGAIESYSISGDVIFKRVKAQRVEAGSVSGNVRLEDVACDRVEVHSTSGDLTFAGPLARNGRYDMKTFSGELRLALPAGSGFEVQANSFSGDVRSDLPITMHGNPDTGRGRHRTILNGTSGDGSAVLDLTTFSGSIVISKR